MLYFFIALIVLLAVLVVANIKVVPQSRAYVIERLGTYKETWQTGLHIKVPFIEHVSKNVSLKEQVVDFPPQPVITKDNVTMQIDTVVFFQITDPKLYTYGVENPISAIENLSATTLRNIIGDLDLDTTLVSRDTINAQMRAILDEATDAWGIKVNRVEVKNVLGCQLSFVGHVAASETEVLGQVHCALKVCSTVVALKVERVLTSY